MTFEPAAVRDELDRLYRQALDNGLDRQTARAFASGSIHDQLAYIVRNWQDARENDPPRHKPKPRPVPQTKTVDADGVKIYVDRESSRCWVAWVDEDDARAVGLERIVGVEFEGPTQREALASAISDVLANRTDKSTGFRHASRRTS